MTDSVLVNIPLVTSATRSRWTLFHQQVGWWWVCCILLTSSTWLFSPLQVSKPKTFFSDFNIKIWLFTHMLYSNLQRFIHIANGFHLELLHIAHLPKRAVKHRFPIADIHLLPAMWLNTQFQFVNWRFKKVIFVLFQISNFHGQFFFLNLKMIYVFVLKNMSNRK